MKIVFVVTEEGKILGVFETEAVALQSIAYSWCKSVCRVNKTRCHHGGWKVTVEEFLGDEKLFHHYEITPHEVREEKVHL